MKPFIAIIMILIVMSGCAWLHPQRSVIQETTHSLQAGKIIDPELFERSKTICIIPFSPDRGVEANTSVNRAALMMVKGFTESFKDAGSSLKVVFGEEAEQTDLLVSGRITEVRRTPLLKRWLRFPDITRIKVEAKITSPLSKKTVGIYQIGRESENKQQTLQDMGYMIGKDIGHYLDEAMVSGETK